MADLIDGYCRLQGEHKGSLIVHPKKGGFARNSPGAEPWMEAQPSQSSGGSTGRSRASSLKVKAKTS